MIQYFHIPGLWWKTWRLTTVFRTMELRPQNTSERPCELKSDLELAQRIWIWIISVKFKYVGKTEEPFDVWETFQERCMGVKWTPRRGRKIQWVVQWKWTSWVISLYHDILKHFFNIINITEILVML